MQVTPAEWTNSVATFDRNTLECVTQEQQFVDDVEAGRQRCGGGTGTQRSGPHETATPLHSELNKAAEFVRFHLRLMIGDRDEADGWIMGPCCEPKRGQAGEVATTMEVSTRPMWARPCGGNHRCVSVSHRVRR